MREIKFRAWDLADHSKWGDHKGMVFFDIYSKPDFIGNTFCRAESDRFEDRFEIMQFTGLYDRNGVEIYEGDIVESDDMLPSEVCFDESGFCFSFGDWPICDYLVMNDERSLKVIGNIHQDPELLK